VVRPVVTVSRRLPGAVEQRLAELFDVRLNTSDEPLGADRLSQALASSDGVVSTLGDPLGAATLDCRPVRARIIAHFGVGYDNIDVAAARARGMTVTNTPGVLTDDTADLTMLLILGAARRAGEGERELRAGAWTGWRPTHLLGTRVSGKTLGLVGFGRIGRAVARRARDGFGMRVVAWSRSLTETAANDAGVTRSETLEGVLTGSDVVSVHVPSSTETRPLLDARRIALLPRHALLVNSSRGDVVDEAALILALRRGEIRGAGLDVFEREPDVSQELLSLSNVFALPHLGSATEESRTAMGMRVVANLEAFFRGDEVPDRVA
jgi:lactate dehydrogenase-like 2-hydroxyacid dehydrogenase